MDEIFNRRERPVPVEEKKERNAEMLRKRVAGATYDELADQYGTSAQRAYLITRREATRAIDQLEMELLSARKTGEVIAFLVPEHAGPDFDAAIEWFRFCVAELEKRGVELRIHYRPTPNGVAFGVEDVTDYSASKEDA